MFLRDTRDIHGMAATKTVPHWALCCLPLLPPLATESPAAPLPSRGFLMLPDPCLHPCSLLLPPHGALLPVCHTQPSHPWVGRRPCVPSRVLSPIFPLLHLFQPLTQLRVNYLYPSHKCSPLCTRQTLCSAGGPRTQTDFSKHVCRAGHRANVQVYVPSSFLLCDLGQVT